MTKTDQPDQNGPQLLEVCLMLPRVHCMTDVHKVRVPTYHSKIRKNSRECNKILKSVKIRVCTCSI